MGRRWMALLMLVCVAVADDTNTVFSPCMDSTIQRFDGFTLGLAFSSKDNFFLNQTQLSPCDNRLQLSSSSAQLAIFRPKVDEISLLTLDKSFIPSGSGGYMVAFAGQKYAARSPPTFIGDDTRVFTNFTLVLEFEKGTLYNMLWNKYGCEGCKGKAGVECVDHQDCAVQTSKCKSNATKTSASSMECSIGIQVLFSGTDKHNEVLNSWYESDNLRKNSLFGL